MALAEFDKTSWNICISRILNFYRLSLLIALKYVLLMNCMSLTGNL